MHHEARELPINATPRLHLTAASSKHSSSLSLASSPCYDHSIARCPSPACFLDSRAVPQRLLKLLQRLIYLALNRHCTEAPELVSWVS